MAPQFDQAIHSFKEGRYEEAVHQLTQLAQVNGQDAQVRLWLGATYRELGQLESARIQFQEALQLTTDPKLINLARMSLAKLPPQNRMLPAAMGLPKLLITAKLPAPTCFQLPRSLLVP